MRKYKILLLLLILAVSGELQSQVGWQIIASPYAVNYSSVYFANANTGFIVGGYQSLPYPYRVIIKTINGGTTWTSILQTNNAGLLDVCFVNSQTGYAVGGFEPNGVILRTTNTGVNWSLQNSGLTKEISSVFFINEYVGFCTSDNGIIIKTTNGGTNWYQVNTGNSYYLESIYFTNPLVGYAVGRVGQIIKSINAGENWFSLISYSNWLNSITFTGQDTGYAVGVGGLLLKTSNSGMTWNNINTGFTDEFTCVKFVNLLTGYITGNNGRVLFTTNSGQSWISQTTGTTKKIVSIFYTDQYKGIACGDNALILKTQTGGQPLYIPTLVSPANGSFNNSVTPTLKWRKGNNITSYKVHISSLSNFSVITDSAILTDSQYTVPSGKLQPATTYFWRVNATSAFGTGPWSDVWNFATILTSVEITGSGTADRFELLQNYPNPFNSATNIKFKILNPGNALIKMYDISGRLVGELFNGYLQAGEYNMKFNAGNLPSGIYLYRLSVNNGRSYFDVKKMIIIK
ncbi:MAG: T9SS type A sorting domain-containing protein [Ignavibacteria bacterium]|nr:T9SS type A sorting domain-containing protein [Ignavibacteria bacterium]